MASDQGGSAATLFALENLLITREGDTLWFEGREEPLTKETARIVSCHFHDPGLHAGEHRSYTVACGSRAYLSTVDAVLKIVTGGGDVGLLGDGVAHV